MTICLEGTYYVSCQKKTFATRWNYQGFWSAWEDLLSFSVTGETEKIVGLWFAERGSVPRMTLCVLHYNYGKKREKNRNTPNFLKQQKSFAETKRSLILPSLLLYFTLEFFIVYILSYSKTKIISKYA